MFLGLRTLGLFLWSFRFNSAPHDLPAELGQASSACGQTVFPSVFKVSPDGSSPSATRKKLFEIARTFSEKTKRRRSKRKVLLKHHSYPPEPPELLSLVCFCSLSSLTEVLPGWARPSPPPTCWMTSRATPAVRPPSVEFPAAAFSNQQDKPLLFLFVQKKTASRDEQTLRERRSRAASPYHGESCSRRRRRGGEVTFRISPLIPDAPALQHIRVTMARAS